MVSDWSLPHGGAFAPVVLEDHGQDTIEVGFETSDTRIRVRGRGLLAMATPRGVTLLPLSRDLPKPIFVPTEEPSKALAVAGDPARMAVVDDEDMLAIFHLPSTNPVFRCRLPQDIESLTFDPGGVRLGALGPAGRAWILDSGTRTEAGAPGDGNSRVDGPPVGTPHDSPSLPAVPAPFPLDLDDSKATALFFSPDGEEVAVADTSKRLTLWSLRSKSRLATTSLSGEVRRGQFLDTHTLVTGSEGGEIRRYDWSDGKLIGRDSQWLGSPVERFEFSQASKRLLVIGSGVQVGVWDLSAGTWRKFVDAGQVPKPAQDGSTRARLVRLGDSGQWIAAADAQRGLLLWEAATGREIAIGLLQGESIHDLEFQDGDRRLLVLFGHREAVSLPLTCLGVPPPAWFPEFTEQVAGCRFDAQVGLVAIARKIRTELVAWVDGQPDSEYRRLASWFLAAPGTGALAPDRPETLAEWVRQGMARGYGFDPARLLLLPDSEARLLNEATGHPLANAIARLWAPHDRSLWEAAVKSDDHYLDTEAPARALIAERAARRFPDHAPFHWAHAKALGRLGAFSNALEALDRFEQAPGGDAGDANQRKTLSLLRAEWRRGWRTASSATNTPSPAAELLTVSPRSPETPSELLNLDPYFNARFDEDWHNFADVGNNLKHLPAGRVRLGDIEWDARGVVQLAGQHLDNIIAGYPRRVTGIPVQRKCRRIHFLGAVGWVSRDGQVVGRLVMNQSDGQKVSLELKYGEHLRNWQYWPDGEREESSGPRPVWKGPKDAWKDAWPASGVRLYSVTWENPSPDVEVTSIDWEAPKMFESWSAPFLVAITVEPATP